MLGNDPAAVNVREVLEGLKKLDLTDILTMLQFDAKVEDVFSDWPPVEQYLTQTLGLSEKQVQSISVAQLDIPGVKKLDTFNFCPLS
jgi:hypothetical protein